MLPSFELPRVWEDKLESLQSGDIGPKGFGPTTRLPNAVRDCGCGLGVDSSLRHVLFTLAIPLIRNGPTVESHLTIRLLGLVADRPPTYFCKASQDVRRHVQRWQVGQRGIYDGHSARTVTVR